MKGQRLWRGGSSRLVLENGDGVSSVLDEKSAELLRSRRAMPSRCKRVFKTGDVDSNADSVRSRPPPRRLQGGSGPRCGSQFFKIGQSGRAYFVLDLVTPVGPGDTCFADYYNTHYNHILN